MTHAENDLEALRTLASDVVERTRRAGADVAEVSARSGWELSAKVRLGETELVEEAGHRSIALRTIKDQRVAITATSDLSEAGIERCIRDALELVELSERDEFAGPASPELLSKAPFPDLDLFDPALDVIDADAAIERARRAERAALSSDARLNLSEGATFSRSTSASALVLSNGFSAVLRGSYASLVVSPVAEDQGGKKRRGFYWTGARHLAKLEEPEAVGVEAARRTLAKLGARKVPTSEAPVVFERDAARSILGTFANCILGGALFRGSSYLKDRVDTSVASSLVHIVDDPLIPGAPGSRPFDGEGLPVARRLVVEGGVLKTYLLDLYSARKLALEPTGHASRSGGSIGASTTNFTLAAGNLSHDEIVAETPRGLYVTEMMGFGFNALTGDFSRGASGFWIEDGKLAYPVSEITISGNLDAMLKGIDRVADDLELKASTASPTFRVASMTIAGS